jgi:hypothetical protein
VSRKSPPTSDTNPKRPSIVPSSVNLGSLRGDTGTGIRLWQPNTLESATGTANELRQVIALLNNAQAGTHALAFAVMRRSPGRNLKTNSLPIWHRTSSILSMRNNLAPHTGRI